MSARSLSSAIGVIIVTLLLSLTADFLDPGPGSANDAHETQAIAQIQTLFREREQARASEDGTRERDLSAELRDAIEELTEYQRRHRQRPRWWSVAAEVSCS
jgi:hypothetical protein